MNNACAVVITLTCPVVAVFFNYCTLLNVFTIAFYRLFALYIGQYAISTYMYTHQTKHVHMNSTY